MGTWKNCTMGALSSKISRYSTFSGEEKTDHVHACRCPGPLQMPWHLETQCKHQVQKDPKTNAWLSTVEERRSSLVRQRTWHVGPSLLPKPLLRLEAVYVLPTGHHPKCDKEAVLSDHTYEDSRSEISYRWFRIAEPPLEYPVSGSRKDHWVPILTAPFHECKHPIVEWKVSWWPLASPMAREVEIGSGCPDAIEPRPQRAQSRSQRCL